jgi:CelD/BcsL family acetyltransferase involved in cellulose biosynthesis
VLSAEAFDSVERLAPFLGEWDDLAVRRERPLSAPAWALGWWRHLRPADADLRVILVRDRDALIGVAPFYASGRYHSMIGGDFGAAEILCAPGREDEVGAAIATTLARSGRAPSLIGLRYRTTSPAWPALIEAGWPSDKRAWGRDLDPVSIPLIQLGDDGFEGWLAGRKGKFRANARRRGKNATADGGGFRLSTLETLDRDVQELLRLHRLRHPGPDGTILADERVAPMLVDCGSTMLESGRFRLYSLEFDQRIVASHLVLTAGPRALAWNSGFDGAFGKYSPPILCLLESMRDAAERGERTIALGEGGQGYKDQLANDEEARRERLMVPRGRTFHLDLLRLRASEMRDRLKAISKNGASAGGAG